jgi:hypothetical protein
MGIKVNLTNPAVAFRRAVTRYINLRKRRGAMVCFRRKRKPRLGQAATPKHLSRHQSLISPSPTPAYYPVLLPRGLQPSLSPPLHCKFPKYKRVSPLRSRPHLYTTPRLCQRTNTCLYIPAATTIHITMGKGKNGCIAYNHATFAMWVNRSITTS